MPVETWFPSFIFYEDLKVDSSVKEGAMAAICACADPILATAGAEGVTANNAPNDLHLDPRMTPLLDVFSEPMRRLLFESLRFDPRQITFYMGRCWPVVHGGNEFGGGAHIHHGGVFSGVFYLQVPEGSGAVQFYKPFRAPHDAIGKTEMGELTFENTVYPAVENRLMMFSSTLLHRRLPNKPSEGERIAIGFDLYTMAALEASGAGIPRFEYLKKMF